MVVGEYSFSPTAWQKQKEKSCPQNAKNIPFASWNHPLFVGRVFCSVFWTFPSVKPHTNGYSRKYDNATCCTSLYIYQACWALRKSTLKKIFLEYNNANDTDSGSTYTLNFHIARRAMHVQRLRTLNEWNEYHSRIMEIIISLSGCDFL